MSRAFNKGKVLLAVWFAHMSAYRAEIVIWMLTGAVPLIMLAVWIGKATASGGTLGGFTPQDFAAYFLAAWITQQLVVAWVAWDLDTQIRTGGLSPKLLRPLDYLWEQASNHVAERLVRLPFMFLIVVGGLLLVPGTRLVPDLLHLAAYGLAVSLAFTIRFLISYCIGLLAFWFDQATSIEDFYYTIAAFLTGSFAPLEFYPPLVQSVIAWTPFPYVVYHPVRILTGAAGGAEIVRIVSVQGAWVILWAMLRLLLWRRGIRRYGAVGA